MNAFKEKCIALRKKDYSIIEIMEVTGRAKSSIRVHIKNIPLSEKRLKEINEASGKRIREFALARKGKSTRSFKPFEGWTKKTISLMAHLLFDGGIYPNSGCAYNNRSEALLKHVEVCMRVVYEFNPTWHTNPLTGVSRISYHNVALASYFKQKVRELLRDVHTLPIDLKREFVRAFFNDEGCIDYRPEKNRRSIRGYQKDIRILKIIKSLLADLDIASRIVFPNEVVIVGKENLMRFEQEINFSSGVYMNGNRSNSRWKKHVEKRELLKLAIKSFKS